MNRTPDTPDSSEPILAPGDPPPYTIVNPDGTAPFLILCDHASNTIPGSLNNLGLTEADRNKHIAIDIGARVLSLELSRRFDAPLIYANYSRLVVDLNRYPDDPTLAPPVSDGIVVPGNQGLDNAELLRRVEELHTPYHDAVSSTLAAIRKRHEVPAIFYVHSFTPEMNGNPRPWHLGVLHADDGRMATGLLTALASRNTGLTVGRNVPYNAIEPKGYSMFQHAVASALPYLCIEVRQDLLETDEQIYEFADTVEPSLQTMFANEDHYSYFSKRMDSPYVSRLKEPAFTVGVEEEYMLVDRETRELINEAPPEMLPECERLLGDRVQPEFLQCQIEVGTPVCSSVSELREHLNHLRRTVAGVVEQHDLALIAASTHPFAIEGRQSTTRHDRYDRLAENLQQVVRRLLISGMHVHVGIDDPDMRVDLMGQVSYVLPHFLALSTSSPFWQGASSGLKSYRISVWDEMPRTGLPEQFDSHAEYQRHVDVLVNAGIIDDASMLWWDVRPSTKFPTLEMRISDVCTRVEDAVCVASLYICWLRMLWRLRSSNQRWRRYMSMLVSENRWRAHRYGVDEGLIDFGRGVIVPWPELIDEIIELIKEDAEHMDCVEEVEHARNIVRNGTSAHRQLQTYHLARADGVNHDDAMCRVVDMLARETLRGV